MKLTKRRWLALAGVLFLAGLVVLGAIAKQWLESTQGQALLQRELSNRLGMSVTINPGYELGFFPTISIEGTGLTIAGRHAPGTFLTSGIFETEVEVLPLFRQEVKITTVELADGTVNLDEAPVADPAAKAAGGGLTLPEVQSLSIQDFTVRLAEDGLIIRVERLTLSGFTPGAAVPVELEAAIPGDTGNQATVVLEGGLTLGVQPPSAILVIESLGLKVGEFALADVGGTLEWRSEPGTVKSRLAWQGEQRSVSIDLGIELGDTLTGALTGQFADPAIEGKVQTEFDIHTDQQRVQWNAIRLEVAGQVVQGQGCFMWKEMPDLRLMLESEQLDLDRFQALIPEGGGATEELPLDLSISLTVAQARLRGAEAFDSRVLIGSEPVCP